MVTPNPETSPPSWRLRRSWRRARSLDDWAAIVIGWLLGRVPSLPWYCGAVDVDTALAPDIIDGLLFMNDAGAVTVYSQGGYAGIGYDGALWQQVAAVEAIASPRTIEALRARLAGTRYGVTVGQVVPVTWRAGSLRHVFEVADDEWCPVTALGETIVVWDPLVGANDMWSVLSGQMHCGAQSDGATQRTPLSPPVNGPSPGLGRRQDGRA